MFEADRDRAAIPRDGAGPAPIELAPSRRARGQRALRGRRAAGWAHLALALAIVLAVFVQVYLIGSYIFGAGSGALDAHRSVGWITHGLEGVLFLVALLAWLPRTDLLLSFLLAAIGTAQVAIVDSTEWLGGLHPLLALVVLGLAAALAMRGMRRLARGELRTARPSVIRRTR